jgi:hypothetical protein
MELAMRVRLSAAALCLVGCGASSQVSDARYGGSTVATSPSSAVPAGATDDAVLAARLVRPEVPIELIVPDDHKLALVAAARGVQIYECTAEAGGGPTWKLRAPRAELFDAEGGQIAIHFGGVDKNLPSGPYWQSTKDGSRVHASKSMSSPQLGAIPLLRLQASDASGHGMFSQVSYVHRLATTGGTAPSEACAPGKRLEVPYTAQYYFYNAPRSQAQAAR